jgi:hypothetical protein
MSSRLGKLTIPRARTAFDMAKYALGALILTIGALALTGTGSSADRAAIQQLQSPDWEKRAAALRAIVANHGDTLTDLSVQRTLSQLLERESAGPGWGGKSEFVAYSDYYTLLLETLQTIATEFNSPFAWKALTRSNYDDNSKFAKWMATQPQAIEYLLALTKDGNEVIRARASFVLAKALGRCSPPADPDRRCGAAIHESDEILMLLRKNARNARSSIEQLSAVRGLGICGGTEDLALLEELSRTNNDRWFGLFVHKSEGQIENRHKGTKPTGKERLSLIK